MLIIWLSDCAWAVAPNKHKNAVNPMMISVLIFIFLVFSTAANYWVAILNRKCSPVIYIFCSYFTFKTFSNKIVSQYFGSI